MVKSCMIALIGALTVASAAWGQSAPASRPVDFELTAGGHVLTVDFWAPNVARVKHAVVAERPAKDGERRDGERSLWVAPSANQDARPRVENTGGKTIVATGKLQVVVDDKTGVVEFLDGGGRPLIKENRPAVFEPLGPDGNAAAGGADANDEDANADDDEAGAAGKPAKKNKIYWFNDDVTPKGWFHVSQQWSIEKDTRVYGGGNHASNRFGVLGDMPGGPNNTTDGSPMYTTSKGFGMLVATMSSVRPSFNKSGTFDLQIACDYELDYFVIAGNLDEQIRGYRQVTGAAPLMPKWAYGYMTSRVSYWRDEMLDVGKKFRELHFPLDVIVRAGLGDNAYWKNGWNGMAFNESNGWANVDEMSKQLHAMGIRWVINTKSDFGGGVPVAKAMAAAGMPLLPYKGVGGPAFDNFNPQARRMYWEAARDGLWKYGVDGWWADGNDNGLWGVSTMGSVLAMRNAFPVNTCRAWYEGQRADAPYRRVFVLSRGIGPGVQRYATATWTGDQKHDWANFQHQLIMGYNCSLSGIPYWGTDIGGYRNNPADDPQLYIRWFQAGAFWPTFRTHGHLNLLPWFWGDEGFEGPKREKGQTPDVSKTVCGRIYRILKANTELRYRLMPYIYTQAWRVTADGDSFIRPLVMDFAADEKAADIADQYMFGRSLMVCPVMQKDAKTRKVYLPAGVDWYDFWTGKFHKGGQQVEVDTPLEHTPVFVRAGTILPMGPVIEWTTQKPTDPLELRIYGGADGSYTLYEDEGDGYQYERGVCSTIRFDWDDAKRELKIAARQGEFPGMLKERTINVALVGDGNGLGDDVSKPHAELKYDGQPVTKALP
jgi:alpha-D-xyloside xylohydrolase